MKCSGLLAVLLFQLVPLGALAVELDEITLDVIDARANSVDDVMRKIEIPRYERKTVRDSEPVQPSAMVQAGNGAEHVEDHREGADSSHHEAREDAHVAHEEAVEDMEEAHHEAVEDIDESREEAIEDIDESHDDTLEDIIDVELPGKPVDIEEHHGTGGSGKSD